MVRERLRDCALGEMGYDGSTTHRVRYERFNPYERRKELAMSGNITLRLPFNDSYWVRAQWAACMEGWRATLSLKYITSQYRRGRSAPMAGQC